MDAHSDRPVTLTTILTFICYALRDNSDYAIINDLHSSNFDRSTAEKRIQWGISKLRRRPIRLCQIWCKSVHGGFWANGWNITKFFIYLFIYTFFTWNHLQVKPIDGFSRLIAQTTRTRARMCLLGVSLILLSIVGVKYPKTPIFGAWIRVFKQNGQNIESFMLS